MDAVYNCTRMLDETFDQPRAAATAMIGFDRPWCIAGGWAIDLALARATREHKDVEIAIFREDQNALREYLADWEWRVVVDGRLIAWQRAEALSLPIHELHATGADGTKLEFLLNERDTIDWIYRREARIRRPIEKAIRRGGEGIPVLAAEIVLLYKSKNPRPADELDFRAAQDLLDDESRRWLSDALSATSPDHPWKSFL
jgi:hypothetical protein